MTASRLKPEAIRRPMPVPERRNVEISRLDRAGTLLLASFTLGVVATVGWGGPMVDLRLIGEAGSQMVGAIREGTPIGATISLLFNQFTTRDAWPLLGTLVSVLFVWHVLSLLAE